MTTNDTTPKMNLVDVGDIAKNFLERTAGFYNIRLIKSFFDNSTNLWHMEFEYGYFQPVILKVTIKDDTGSIIDYERRPG